MGTILRRNLSVLWTVFMISKYARLDRFLSQRLGQPRAAVQRMLAAGRVQVSGALAKDGQQRVGPFTEVLLDGEILQANQARYLMLNKPAGVVSATRDLKHTTVLDLLPEAQRADLHIAGRLDFNSTGLLLLTNDGRWSRQLSAPENNIRKRYRVTLEKPLNDDYIQAFAEGMFFDVEGVVTRPAQLVIVSDYVADVWLVEGRYHQIKRMFGRFHNKVMSLHRSAIGALELDLELASGCARPLSLAEVRAVNPDY